MMMSEVDWSAQHCGVHQAPWSAVISQMFDVATLITHSFPDRFTDFTWDVKVHMLMPGQYPCIPHWHRDFVPRRYGIQQFHECQPDKPIYMWLSGPPLTQFKHGYVQAQQWVRFSQLDEHRGIPADNFCWRGFIRATHKDIVKPKGFDGLDDT